MGVAVLLCCSASGQSRIQQVDTVSVASVSCDVITANPMDQTDRVFTTFTLPDSLVVSISILDTLSNLVYEFSPKTCGAGIYQVHWWYEDIQGKSVAVGVYVFDLVATSVHRSSEKEFRYRQRFLALPSD